MAGTIRVDSFSSINIAERSELGADYLPDSAQIILRSTQGFEVGQPIYVGNLSREGCESAVVASVDDETTVTLAQPLKLPHRRYEAVTATVGDSIRIYRAANVDGRPPADGAFTVLATRSIDPDQQSTYYRDPDGSSDYWYRTSYVNTASLMEVGLSTPERGDAFNHYASLTEIRKDAGFESAHNLADSVVALQRRIAEAEINGALSGAYSTPFNPAPEAVKALTIQLASAFLQVHAYGETSSLRAKLKAARDAIENYRVRAIILTDDDGNAMSNSDTIAFYPGEPSEEAPRMFRMRDMF